MFLKQQPKILKTMQAYLFKKIILLAELIAAHTEVVVYSHSGFFGQLVSLEVSHPTNEAAPEATYFDNEYNQ